MNFHFRWRVTNDRTGETMEHKLNGAPCLTDMEKTLALWYGPENVEQLRGAFIGYRVVPPIGDPLVYRPFR